MLLKPTDLNRPEITDKQRAQEQQHNKNQEQTQSNSDRGMSRKLVTSHRSFSLSLHSIFPLNPSSVTIAEGCAISEADEVISSIEETVPPPHSVVLLAIAGTTNTDRYK
ncbi:hypothetical protein P8452_41651 [Trifolium repens]|nr:hypothetical protein P8452_41651 [Trifolium repens]